MSIERRAWLHASAAARSAASPAAWPEASLSCLKPSRSSRATASGVERRLARFISRRSASSKARRFGRPVRTSVLAELPDLGPVGVRDPERGLAERGALLGVALRRAGRDDRAIDALERPRRRADARPPAAAAAAADRPDHEQCQGHQPDDEQADGE